MCQAPNHMKLPQVPQVALPYQHRRQRRLAQIVRMLRSSAQATPTACPLNKLAFAALSIKLERLIYGVLPSNTGILSDELLELRMRRVIHRILDTKKAKTTADIRSSDPAVIVAL